MSATLSHDPNKLPAGILALAVHGAFFSLLYFGFNWQALPPATMHVDLWQSLPEEVATPQASPPPVSPKVDESVKPAQPVPAVKPDIVLPDKKKPVDKVVAKPVVTKPDKKKVEVEPVIQKPLEQKPAEQSVAPSIQDQKADREKAEKAAEINRIVDEFKAKITAKIRRNIVMLPDVAKDARAEFAVTLLPGGTVLKVELKKPSGNSSYDNAVERAILKSDPLPLPADVALFNRFRELDLVFKPTE